jgi:hypothetical protein
MITMINIAIVTIVSCAPLICFPVSDISDIMGGAAVGALATRIIWSDRDRY